MRKSLLTLLRFIGYTAAAILGWLVHVFLAVPMQFALGPISRTCWGRRCFVTVSRSRARVWWVALFAFVVAIPLHLDPWVGAGLSLTVLAIGRVLFNYHGRILLVSNIGTARWTVHMNLLKADKPATLWKGAFEELDNLIRMARAAGIEGLKFKSPLLVNDATARLLQGKLDRVLANNGLTARATVSEPKAMGVLGTGLIHVYLVRQKRLKSKRKAYHCKPWNLNTRKVEVEITSASSPTS